MVSVEVGREFSILCLRYATHTTGVILRAYDSNAFRNEENKVVVCPVAKAKGIMEIMAK